jgi:hypothetical protein
LSVELTRTEGAHEHVMATTDYLKRRGETWFVRVQIPKHLWKAAGGKREYVKTLKTRDLSEANRLKHPYVAAFKERICMSSEHFGPRVGNLREYLAHLV